MKINNNLKANKENIITCKLPIKNIRSVYLDGTFSTNSSLKKVPTLTFFLKEGNGAFQVPLELVDLNECLDSDISRMFINAIKQELQRINNDDKTMITESFKNQLDNLTTENKLLLEIY